jgi:hypothetical protein
MLAPLEPADTRSDRGIRAAVVLCTAVVVLTALYFTGTIFAPLAFAMLIIAEGHQMTVIVRLDRAVASQPRRVGKAKRAHV